MFHGTFCKQTGSLKEERSICTRKQHSSWVQHMICRELRGGGSLLLWLLGSWKHNEAFYWKHVRQDFPPSCEETGPTNSSVSSSQSEVKPSPSHWCELCLPQRKLTSSTCCSEARHGQSPPGRASPRLSACGVRAVPDTSHFTNTLDFKCTTQPLSELSDSTT